MAKTDTTVTWSTKKKKAAPDILTLTRTQYAFPTEDIWQGPSSNKRQKQRCRLKNK